MTSGTAVIKNSDMEIHMEKDVINLSSIAFQKFSVEKDIASVRTRLYDSSLKYMGEYGNFFRSRSVTTIFWEFIEPTLANPMVMSIFRKNQRK